jgi:hypothetical protein
MGLSIHNLKLYGVGHITVTKPLLYMLILLTKDLIIAHVFYFEYCRCFIHFSYNTIQLLLKTCCFSKNLKFSLDHFNQVHSLLPCVWTPFTFWEAYFHRIKGRETPSISHNDFNTTDDKATPAGSTELHNVFVRILNIYL